MREKEGEGGRRREEEGEGERRREEVGGGGRRREEEGGGGRREKGCALWTNSQLGLFPTSSSASRSLAFCFATFSAAAASAATASLAYCAACTSASSSLAFAYLRSASYTAAGLEQGHVNNARCVSV